MTNKYQEALDNVSKAPNFMGGNTRYKNCTESSFLFNEDIKTLQELVDNVNELEKENQELKCQLQVSKDIRLEYKKDLDNEHKKNLTNELDNIIVNIYKALKPYAKLKEALIKNILEDK